ncbi:hypothetical protein FQA39_LY11733 [Lamprigera yunnana]|nr:hypothetical protein FQA39_LY11733 [Lamprigera yunnana]
MKTAFLILTVILLQVTSQRMTLDPKTEHCIKEKGTRDYISAKYTPLQIITGLSRYRLNIFGNYELTPSDNAYYNTFLTCSWMEYGYFTKPDDINFEVIEDSLKNALIREVGETGPGINLSKVQAKSIVEQCRNITAVTIGIKIVYIQNCIHKQILYLNKIE